MNLLHVLELESRFKKKYIPFILVILIAVVILEIWSTNRLATYGAQITKLEQTRMALATENQILQKQIAEKSSLVQNEKLAQDLGFLKTKKIEYIKVVDSTIAQTN